MKKVLFIISITAIFAACNNKPAAEAKEEQMVAIDSSGTKYLVDTASSILYWEGKALSYGHNGTIKLSEGSLFIKDGMLSAGSFIIDIKSINNLDLTDPEKNAYLVGHLNDTDFFDSKKYPEGKFEITKVDALQNDTSGNTHTISGNLTLKGQSNNITFPIKAIVTENSFVAKGTVMINRLNWGVKYGSTTAFPNLKAKLKDKAINDEFKVIISLSARKG